MNALQRGDVGVALLWLIMLGGVLVFIGAAIKSDVQRASEPGDWPGVQVVCIADFVFVEAGGEPGPRYGLAQLLDEGGRGIRCAEFDPELH